ncbi:hypothetical protein ABZP36_007536 [Zizania latifolia]
MGGSSPPPHSSFLPPPSCPPWAAHLVASAAAALFSETAATPVEIEPAAPPLRDEDSVDAELGVVGLLLQSSTDLGSTTSSPSPPLSSGQSSAAMPPSSSAVPFPSALKGAALTYMLVHATTSPPPLDRQDLEASARTALDQEKTQMRLPRFLGLRCRGGAALACLCACVREALWSYGCCRLAAAAVVLCPPLPPLSLFSLTSGPLCLVASCYSLLLYVAVVDWWVPCVYTTAMVPVRV